MNERRERDWLTCKSMDNRASTKVVMLLIAADGHWPLNGPIGINSRVEYINGDDGNIN